MPMSERKLRNVEIASRSAALPRISKELLKALLGEFVVAVDGRGDQCDDAGAEAGFD